MYQDRISHYLFFYSRLEELPESLNLTVNDLVVYLYYINNQTFKNIHVIGMRVQTSWH